MSKAFELKTCHGLKEYVWQNNGLALLWELRDQFWQSLNEASEVPKLANMESKRDTVAGSVAE